MSKFTLTIKMGNDAVQTGEDIAEVLHQVAYVIEQQDRQRGPIIDSNGNTVGKWEVTE